MEPPANIYYECPACKEDTLHHVKNARFSTRKSKVTLDGTAECSKCGLVHHIQVIRKSDREFPLLLSNGKETKKTFITLPADEELELGLEIMHGDSNIMITKLEKNGIGLRRGKAGELDIIWAKSYDNIQVSISVSHGPETYSRKIIATPDEEFEIGNIITFDEYKVVIKKIRDTGGMVKQGVVKVRDIVRIYTRLFRSDKTVRRKNETNRTVWKK